jgi:hypothetical protein
MARALVLLFAVFMSALPAFGGGAVDTATVTCKDYQNGTHQDMMDILAALKATPTFGALSEDELDGAIDKACTGHREAKVIDALHLIK